MIAIATVDLKQSGTPGADGWVYHHLLPWRYYSFLGAYFAACAQYKARLFEYHEPRNPSLHKACAALYANGRGGGATLADWPRTTHNLTPSQYLKLCKRLDHRGNNGVFDTFDATYKFNLTAIGSLTSAPYFGGFLAMSTTQRDDDPESRFEPVVPVGLRDSLAKTELMQLRDYLLQSSRQELKTRPKGVPIEVGAALHDSIIDLTEALLETKYSRLGRAYPFEPSDWGCLHTGHPVAWTYLGEVENEPTRRPAPRKFVLLKEPDHARCGRRRTAAQTRQGTQPDEFAFPSAQLFRGVDQRNSRPRYGERHMMLP